MRRHARMRTRRRQSNCHARHRCEACGSRAPPDVLLRICSRPGKQQARASHRPEGKGMLHPLRAAARLINQKIGWNRIGLALSLIIITAAVVVLYRILRGIDVSDVVVALKATDPADVLLASLFVAAGYFTLTCDDL